MPLPHKYVCYYYITSAVSVLLGFLCFLNDSWFCREGIFVLLIKENRKFYFVTVESKISQNKYLLLV